MRVHFARLAFGAAALILALGVPASAGGQVGLWLGQKTVADDPLVEHRGLEDQPQFGVTSSWDFGWPVALAVDILASSDDGPNTYTFSSGVYDFTYEYDADISTMELNLGVRKFWGEKIRPYLGGGIAFVQFDAEMDLVDVTVEGGKRGKGLPERVIDDDDSDLGYFANAGIEFRIGDRFSLGLDARYSDATAEIEDPFGTTRSTESQPIDIDSGGVHYGLVLGFRW